MSHLIHLIYASAATGDPAPAELAGILADARGRNAAVGLTGMLLFTGGSFFQVLEGEPEVVDRVFNRIAADPRHGSIVTIIRERIPARAFGEWSMGFVAASAPELEAARVAGANDFFAQASCFDALPTGRAKKLLSAFRAGRWHLGAA